MLRALAHALTGQRLRAEDSTWLQYDRPLVVAHRGGGGLRPENTMPAFEHAADLGVDAFETDVHLTRDGELVVSHDPDLDRISDGTGAIARLSLAEVQQADAGYHWSDDNGATFPWRGQGVQIPTVRELFTRFPDKRYILDCKPENPIAARKLAEVAMECGVGERVCLASFSHDNVLAIRDVHPSITTSLSSPEVHVFWAAQILRCDALYRNKAHAIQVPPTQYGVPFLTRHFIQRAHANNMHVHAWTIDEEEEMRRLLALGVDGIITDYPDRLLRVMASLP